MIYTFLLSFAALHGCRFLAQEEGANSKPCLVSFGDVGQGDATAVISPNGRSLLVDAGPDSLKILAFLNNLPLDTVHVLLISHAHEDHIGAVAAVFRHFPVKRLVYSADTNLGKYRYALDSLIREFSVDTCTLFFGDSLLLDERLNLAVLWPRQFSAFSDNNLSTVLKLTYGNSSILLAGDIHEEAELEIGRLQISLDSDILKVPHHGSRTSSSLPFLAAVSPEWAVISCDSSIYGLPDEETLADLQQVGLFHSHILRTDRLGTIQFRLFPGRVEFVAAIFGRGSKSGTEIP